MNKELKMQQDKSKPYHKEQLKALTDSMYKYPYQNLSLVDMDGEQWKELPGYEDYYMVSNKGRIKTLARDIAHYIGKNYISHRTDEAIIKQSIFKSYSKYRDEYVSALVFGVTVGKNSNMMRVSRAVYEVFVGQIPKGMLVLHKGDPLDNSVENLYAATRKELARQQHHRNREIINAKGGLFAEKTISQYDPEGNYVATFNSMVQAAQAIGIDASNITEVVNGNRFTAGGYFWRQGKDKSKLDVAYIYQKLKEKQKAAAKIHHKSIVQYSLKGEYIETYESIKEAIEKTGLSRDAIGDVLRGKRYLSREFIWKYAASFEDGNIPPRIIVEEYKHPEPTQPTNMPKGQKQPRYDYPYQNLFLYDMEGEIWKEVPTLETYCMVSNFGRVKALARFFDRPNHGRVFLKERIIKQNLHAHKPNHWTGERNCSLYFALGIEGKLIQMAVSRAVYSAFVERLPDFKEDKMCILHKDLDNLNNRVENLYIANQQELGKRNVKEGLTSPPDISEFTDELWLKIKEIRSRPVSQFSKEGKFIATYPSITEANRITGASKGGIAKVAQGKERQAGGFIWRFGSDTKNLDAGILQKYNRKKRYPTRAISQYDPDGNLIHTFESITEAANQFGCDRRKLNYHIMQNSSFGGFIWRYANKQP